MGSNTTNKQPSVLCLVLSLIVLCVGLHSVIVAIPSQIAEHRQPQYN